MKQETRQCQNCHQNFIIEPDDLMFYEKIRVPIPTWCSECRMKRRLLFRNERILYHRKCDAPSHSESLISVYSPDKQLKVCDQEYWWSDAWDPLDYGSAYDFSRPFFEQFRSLFNGVFWPNLVNSNGKNSEYCHTVINLKNCYFVFGAGDSENILYSNEVDYGKDSLDLSYSISNELCYQNLFCNECYRVFFSSFSQNSSDSFFLCDCNGCVNCFGCIGLRNKAYHIFNVPYSKDEYAEKIKSFDLSRYSKLQEMRKIFSEFCLKFPHRYSRLFKSVGSSGDNLWFTKNAQHCFDSVGEGMEDAKDVILTFTKAVKDVQSSYSIGNGSSLVYDSISVTGSHDVAFSKKVWSGNNVRYSFNCHDSSNIFGCVNLRNKSYCILNRQYTKEDYNSLVPRIIQHMNEMPYVDKKGRVYKYGEFFPTEISPFAYNETLAQEYYPLTKQEILSEGYEWKDPDTKSYAVTLPSAEIPDAIADVSDDVIDKIIGCAHNGECSHQCATAFRIIPEEIQFYRRMNLPLPRLCPNCRHYERLAQRNPLKLWHRQCMCDRSGHFHEGNCPNEFETSYAPERKEIVYCEQCYQAEIS